MRVQHLEHIMDRLKEKGAQMAQVEEWLQQQVEVQRGLEQRLKGALAETAKWRDRYEVDIKGLKQQLVDCETELRRWKSGRQEVCIERRSEVKLMPPGLSGNGGQSRGAVRVQIGARWCGTNANAFNSIWPHRYLHPKPASGSSVSTE